MQRRWGCPECGASRGLVAERRVLEEVPITFTCTPEGGWSEVLDLDSGADERSEARYRCTRCLAIFDAPAPLPRCWYA